MFKAKDLQQIAEDREARAKFVAEARNKGKQPYPEENSRIPDMVEDMREDLQRLQAAYSGCSWEGKHATGRDIDHHGSIPGTKR